VSAVPLRLAVLDDAPVLSAIADAAYSPYLARMPGGLRPGPMDADYGAVVARGDTWVAVIDGETAGCLVLDAMGDHLLVENVAVHPRFQGRGVGGRMLAFAESQAEARGLPELRLFTHAVMVENQRLYERLGYVETTRRRDHGFDRVFYAKRL
jgi:ribosomal protein S18 acetylase RimI-like enzyme